MWLDYYESDHEVCIAVKLWVTCWEITCWWTLAAALHGEWAMWRSWCLFQEGLHTVQIDRQRSHTLLCTPRLLLFLTRMKPDWNPFSIEYYYILDIKSPQKCWIAPWCLSRGCTRLGSVKCMSSFPRNESSPIYLLFHNTFNQLFATVKAFLVDGSNILTGSS